MQFSVRRFLRAGRFSKFLRVYKTRLLLVITFGTLVREVIRFIMSPLVPTLIENFGISPETSGFALSLLGALMALFQYPGGRISDSWTRKTVFQFAFVGVIIGSCLLLYSPTFYIFLLGLVILGIAAGLYPPAAESKLSDTFADRQGQVLGLNVGAANLGGMLSTVVVLLVLPVTPWRFVFVPLMVFAVAMVVLIHRVVREDYLLTPVSLEFRDTFDRFFGNSRLRFVLVASSLFSITWQGVLGFFPTILQLKMGFSEFSSSVAFGSLFLVGLFANPLAGTLGDRSRYHLIAAGSTGCGIVGIGVVFFSDGVVPFVVGLVLLGVGLASYWPVMSAYLIGCLSDENLGGDYGAAKSFYLFVGSAGPFIVGTISARVGFSWALVSLCLCAAASGCIWIYLSMIDGERRDLDGEP